MHNFQGTFHRYIHILRSLKYGKLFSYQKLKVKVGLSQKLTWWPMKVSANAMTSEGWNRFKSATFFFFAILLQRLVSCYRQCFFVFV